MVVTANRVIADVFIVVVVLLNATMGTQSIVVVFVLLLLLLDYNLMMWIWSDICLLMCRVYTLASMCVLCICSPRSGQINNTIIGSILRCVPLSTSQHHIYVHSECVQPSVQLLILFKLYIQTLNYTYIVSLSWIEHKFCEWTRSKVYYIRSELLSVVIIYSFVSGNVRKFDSTNANFKWMMTIMMQMFIWCFMFMFVELFECQFGKGKYKWVREL